VEPLKRFRLMAVRASLLLTAVAAFGAYLVNAALGKGVLIGGVGGTLAFWLMARSLERLAGLDAHRVKWYAAKWTFLRWGIYAAVLVRAYHWDPDGLHGFWGAAAGLMIVRAVAALLGLTGLDMKSRDD